MALPQAGLRIERCREAEDIRIQRVQRIEEILNINLSDGETRFNLQLALTIQAMQELLENRAD